MDALYDRAAGARSDAGFPVAENDLRERIAQLEEAMGLPRSIDP